MTAQDEDRQRTGIGARIRALRGDESQAAFAKRIGITRSALANYELERTKPKHAVIARIARERGVSIAAITGGEIEDLEEALTIVGVAHGTETIRDLTGDERAVIRFLRSCDEATIREVGAAILRAVEEGRIEFGWLEVAHFEEDLRAIKRFTEGDLRYRKGVTGSVLMRELARLAKAREGGEQGPQ